MGHADRVAPMTAYCTGLLLPGERKSVEPMAARVEPGRVRAAHQSLHHFVAKSDWSDAAVLTAVRDVVLPVMTAREPIRAWIIDDTGFPKKGSHSVGVARQYCGQLGKQDNCQVAVSLSVAGDHASLPVAYRLYLPESWVEDVLRRSKIGVPEEVAFQTKPQIALDQIRNALTAGLPTGVVLADAGYGIDTAFRTGVRALGLDYVVGVQSSVTLWPPGQGPLPPMPWSGSQGRPPTLQRRDEAHQPTSAKALAQNLLSEIWTEVTWREGTNATLTSRFAAVRVRPAHRDYWLPKPHPEEWLLIEWPESEAEQVKYWLSSLPETTALEELVATAKLRWRIERDYQDLKQELGLGHYEWPRLAWSPPPRHAVHRRLRLPGFRAKPDSPSGPGNAAPILPGPAVPADYRPRGTPDPGRAAR